MNILAMKLKSCLMLVRKKNAAGKVKICLRNFVFMECGLYICIYIDICKTLDLCSPKVNTMMIK